MAAASADGVVECVIDFQCTITVSTKLTLRSVRINHPGRKAGHSFALLSRRGAGLILPADCEQLAISVELQRERRTLDDRCRFETRAGDCLENAGRDLYYRRWECLEQTLVDRELNISAKRGRNLRIIRECDSAGRNRRICQCAGGGIMS